MVVLLKGVEVVQVDFIVSIVSITKRVKNGATIIVVGSTIGVIEAMIVQVLNLLDQAMLATWLNLASSHVVIMQLAKGVLLNDGV